MKLKILIIVYFFPPKNCIASLRPYSWANYWSQWGHDVTVLTADQKPDPGDLKLPLEGFQIIRISLPRFIQGLIRRFKKEQSQNTNNSNQEIKKYSKPSILQRIRERFGVLQTTRMPDHSDLLFYKAYKAVSNTKWDVVVSSYGPYVSHLVAAKLKRKGKAKFWVADYRDLWTRNSYYKGIFPFTILEDYWEKKVNYCADLITSVSEEMVDTLKQTYQSNNIFTVSNGFDPKDLEELNPTEIKYIDPEKFNIVYTGSINRKTRNPEPLIQVIKEISKSENFKLLEKLQVSFFGSNVEQLFEMICKYDVSNWVSCFLPIQRNDILLVQKEADILLFLEKEREDVDGVLTGKLFEYLFSGTKIWGIGITKNCAPGRLIEDSGCGVSFGQNTNFIRDQLIGALQIDMKPIIYPQNKIISQFTRERQAKKLIDLIQSRS